MLREHLAEMKKYDNEFWARGIKYIAGVDEVGRGPLAGPVVAAAVVLPQDFSVIGVDDSKKLSAKKREELFGLILENALAVGIGMRNNKRIEDVYKRQRLDIPLITTCTFGRPIRYLIPHDDTERSGAASFNIALASSLSSDSLPPLSGSITHIGILCSVKISYCLLDVYKRQYISTVKFPCKILKFFEVYEPRMFGAVVCLSLIHILQGILGGIGGISLFVAALSITNTMIMSIYERTRAVSYTHLFRSLQCLQTR